MYLYKKRRWLNRLGQHTVGFVYGRITEEKWSEELDSGITHHHVDVSGQLTVGDCSRMITLDFTPDTNSIRKLDIIIDVAIDMRDLLASRKDSG